MKLLFFFAGKQKSSRKQSHSENKFYSAPSTYFLYVELPYVTVFNPCLGCPDQIRPGLVIFWLLAEFCEEIKNNETFPKKALCTEKHSLAPK